MIRSAALAELTTLLVLSASLAFPATPFGGDDGGFIPPDANTLKCENAVAKNLGKAMACIIKCHRDRASGKLADDTAEDSCEAGPKTSCASKYAKSRQQLISSGLCPSCLDDAAQAMLFQQVEGMVDDDNGQIYCAAGTAFGGDDTGSLPPDNDALKCESGVAKAVSKLIKCVIGCHRDRASGILADDFAENACETFSSSRKSCLLRFNTTSVKILEQGICPACMDGAQVSMIGGHIESTLDAFNGQIYCAP